MKHKHKHEGKKRVIVWVDGGCKGNNEPVALRTSYGSYLVQDVLPRLGPYTKKLDRFMLMEAETSNEAEYHALLRVLKDYTIPNGTEIRTDSALLVGQVANGWRCEAKNLVPLRNKAKTLLIARGMSLVKVDRSEVEAMLGH